MHRDVVAGLVLAAFALGSRPASAQAPPSTAPVYPQADTDRPLVLFPGMTVLDLSLDFITFFETRIETPGTITTTRFIRPELDVTLQHAFGPVEISGEWVGNVWGPFWYLSGQTMLGPGAIAVTLDGQVRAPNTGVGYTYDQTVGYAYKRLVLPHQLAIYAGANIDLNEDKLTPSPPIETRRYRVFGQVSGSVEVQLTPRLALDVGPWVNVLLAHSSNVSDETATLNGGSAMILALGHWDLVGNFNLNDLLAHRPYLFAAVGFVHRWGG